MRCACRSRQVGSKISPGPSISNRIFTRMHFFLSIGLISTLRTDKATQYADLLVRDSCASSPPVQFVVYASLKKLIETAVQPQFVYKCLFASFFTFVFVRHLAFRVGEGEDGGRGGHFPTWPPAPLSPGKRERPG